MSVVNNTGVQKQTWSQTSQMTQNIAQLRQVKLKKLTHPNKGCTFKDKK
jgi:hypothetical protein